MEKMLTFFRARLPGMEKRIETFGAVILRYVDGLGNFTEFMVRSCFWTFRRPFRWNLFFEQLYFVANKSVFIVVLTSSFTGMVMCYQTYFGFKIISVDSLVGTIVMISMAKELAPVLTGLIVAGRCGAAMAAQIGTMKVTEQVDALEVMGINSNQYLAVPRVVASVIALPILSALFLFVSNIGAYIIGTKVLGIDPILYGVNIPKYIVLGDIFQGLIKSVFFGYLIAIIGTYHGFQAEGGAEGVGRRTNLAVVWGMVVVLISDYYLTSFLIRVL